MYTELVLGIIVLASSIVSLVMFFILLFVPSDFSPLRDPLSDYRLDKSHNHKLHFISLFSLALAGISLAVYFYISPLEKLHDLTGYLVVFAVTRVALYPFPIDLKGAKRTRKGDLHWILAIISFGAVAVAAGSYPEPGLYSILGTIVFIAAILMLLVVVVPSLRRRVFGLFERVFVISVISWFLAFGISLL